MADVDEKVGSEARGSTEAGEASESIVSSGAEADENAVVEHLGVDKYVFASFFGAGIGLAFLMGKLLAAGWSMLAEWSWAVRTFPVLLRYAEEERATYTTALGAVVGVIAVVLSLRNDGLRRWAEDVAIELSKVTWPKREAVTNGTIVVIAAGLFATVYIGLLDRLWGFVTMLVYGA